MEDVARIVVDSGNLDNVVLGESPLIISGLNLGTCRQNWKNVNYLKSKVPSDKKVTVHVCPTHQLDFVNKNFQYKIYDFHSFIDKCFVRSNSSDKTSSENYYLRAVGENQRKDVALLCNDFPTIADDVTIPNLFPIDRLFSSVLRISSNNTQLWTHYDIMDNILMQIVGKKKVVLFHPLDAQYLYLSARQQQQNTKPCIIEQFNLVTTAQRDKSHVLDVENPDLNVYPLFKYAKQYRCKLEEGDVLYIPALWFHNTLASTAGVAVNVFWKSLPDKFYDSKDLYGNRDLIPAQRAFQSYEKVVKNFDEMPEIYRKFYALRLIENIKYKFNV